MFEIYESYTKRKKTYIVTPFEMDYWTAMNYFKKFFKASERHIEFISGWVYKDELYLDDPEIKGAKKVGVGFYVS